MRRLIVRSLECTVCMLFLKHTSYIALIPTAEMTSDSIWAWRWTLIVTPLVVELREWAYINMVQMVSKRDDQPCV